MMDLDLNLIINTDQLQSKLEQKTYQNNSDAFSKVLESATKSFNASKNSLTSNTNYTEQNQDVYFLNTKREKPQQNELNNPEQTTEESDFTENNQCDITQKDTEKDIEQEETSENSDKNVSDSTSNNVTENIIETVIENSVENITEEIIENVSKNTTEILSDMQKVETITNNSQKEITTKQENPQNETIKEIVKELSTENKETENKVNTQIKQTTTTSKSNHTQTQAKDSSDENELTTTNNNLQNDELLETDIDVDDTHIEASFEQNDNSADVIIKGDAITNFESELRANNKSKATSSHSETMEDIDRDDKIEVTSVKFGDTANISDKNYNFNSSAFSDLSNHITKMSLNKSADFSKVMNAKTAQENQILNQVKEATSNAIARGTSKVSIILRPENLGKVNVNLASTNGILSAQLIAQNQQAADALNKNIENLKQNLIDQGVKVNDISVKVQESSQSDSFANNNYNDDKLNEFKESNSNRNASKNKQMYENNNENQKENSYFTNLEENNENEPEKTTKLANKGLEIYNNMGRKL